MTRIKYVSIVLALVAATGVVLGGVGFSSVAADRDVSISVVDDADAYVGVIACEDPDDSTNDTTVELKVMNQFTVSFDVDSIEDRQDDGDLPENVEPGESERFTVVLDGTHETVTLHVSNGVFTATVTTDIADAGECPLSDSNDDE